MTHFTEFDKQEHPGWAIQTDGLWLSYAHGWHVAKDGFFARIFSTEHDAHQAALEAQEDFQGGFEYTIVVAWEPLCAKLRREVSALKKANTIDPHKLFQITFNLEEIMADLKDVISDLSPSNDKNT